MAAPKSYFDIGHGTSDATLWLWDNGTLVTWERQRGTHGQWYGPDSMRHWRGRFENETNRLSLAPPQGEQNLPRPPSHLIGILEFSFPVAMFYYFSAGGVTSFLPSHRKAKP